MKDFFHKYYLLLAAVLLAFISLTLFIFAFSPKLFLSNLALPLSLLLLFLTASLFFFSHSYQNTMQKTTELHTLLEANYEELQAHTLIQLCYGTASNSKYLTDNISFFHLNEKLQHISVCLIHFPASAKLSAAFHKDTCYKALEELCQDCKATSDIFFPSFWLREDADTILGVIGYSENFTQSINLAEINLLGSELQNTLAKLNDKPPAIAFGSITSSMEQICQSYNQAAELLNHKLHNHLTLPYCYDDFQRTELQFDYNKQQMLARYIRLGKATDAVSLLNSYFSVIHANPNTSVTYVREVTGQILSLIISLAKEMPVVYADCSSSLEQAEEHFTTLTHVHEFGQFLPPLIEEVCSSILTVSANKGKLKIDRLTTWMNQNYSQDLSLETLAEYIGCSPAYTSKLFKKETTYDIITYLSMIRVQHAKELLTTTKMTLEEISSSVGYNHLQTFIRNFKKLTGLTPTEYRNTCDKQK